LTLDNRLPVSVVLTTGWQPVFIGWHISCCCCHFR